MRRSLLKVWLTSAALLTSLPTLAGVPAMPPNPAANRADWWKRGVIYEIYPWSFADSNNDGIGDVRGISSRLDYIRAPATTSAV